ncbi:MAG: VOC family protein [bacterium]
MMSKENFKKIVPYLTVHDASGAIEFYEKAFGAECDMKMDAEKQMGPEHAGKIMHASLKINDGYVMLSDEFDLDDGETGGTQSPKKLGTSSVTIHIEVTDTKSLWDNAVNAGAEIIMPLADQFWEASYGKLRDPFGHIWSIGGPKMG